MNTATTLPAIDTQAEFHFKVEGGDKPLSALAMLLFQVPDIFSSVEQITVTIRIEGVEIFSFEKNILPASIQHFIVNTLCIPNGDITITVLLNANNISLSSQQHFIVKNTGHIATEVSNNLRRNAAPVIIDTPMDSTLFDYTDPQLFPWFNQLDAEEKINLQLRMRQLTDEEAQVLRSFVQEGYAILPTRIGEELLSEIVANINEAAAEGTEGYQWGSSQRLHHLHLRYDAIKQLWQHPMIMHYLNLIFQSPPRPCQTLTYIFGSEQRPHQDTIHLTPFPAGYMCGVWVALEDVQNNSGELIIYPRTHRMQRLTMNNTGCAKIKNNDWNEFDKLVADRWQNMIDESGIQPLHYRPKRGTILIWHENLMHGGSERIDKSLTRRSIVSHYFADGVIAYYDSIGQAGYLEAPIIT